MLAGDLDGETHYYFMVIDMYQSEKYYYSSFMTL